MMSLYQGENVTLTSGAPSLYTIGVSLGRIPRFCGHTRDLYTVLPHVLTVATILPDRYALYGLLHDAPECMVSDVPTPMKTQVARNRENALLKRIYASTGIKWPISEAAQEAVDEADHLALVAEAHVLGHSAADRIGDLSEVHPELIALVEYHLENVPTMMNPEVSGPIYEEAFNHYLMLGENAGKKLLTKEARAKLRVEWG